MVHCDYQLYVTGTGTLSGQLYMGGLPYATHNSTAYRTSGTIGHLNNITFGASDKCVGLYTGTSSSTLNLQFQQSGGMSGVVASDIQTGFWIMGSFQYII
jgi:hypothetical protein